MRIESSRFYGMLGIAMRAGQLKLGEFGVTQAIAKGKAALVLVDESASPNTKKRIQDACVYRKIPLFETIDGELSRASGKPDRMSAAVTAGSICTDLLRLACAEDDGKT